LEWLEKNRDLSFIFTGPVRRNRSDVTKTSSAAPRAERSFFQNHWSRCFARSLRSLRHLKNTLRFRLFHIAQIFVENVSWAVVQIEPLGEGRRDVAQLFPSAIEQHEVLERNLRAPTVAGRPVRSDSNPRNLARDSGPLCLTADAADTDYRVEIQRAHPPHAVVNAETAACIGIAGMRPLIDQCSHSPHLNLMFLDLMFLEM
jgi:hypothetical protein